jgi:hypothetical protein
MSYDICFLRRDPGQTFEDALDVLDALDELPEVPINPAHWDQVVCGVRELLGEVSVLGDPPELEILHEQTAIQVSCFSGDWSISVPYWSSGEAAAKIASYLRSIAEIVQNATGIEAYDPQLGQAVVSDEWTVQHVVPVFDLVAGSFDERGVSRG